MAYFTETPNGPDDRGRTPIHEAAICGHQHVVKFLSKFSKTPNASDSDGSTPIHLAAKNYNLAPGNLETIRFLAGITDNPMVPNNDGETPLDLARKNLGGGKFHAFNADDVVEFLETL